MSQDSNQAEPILLAGKPVIRDEADPLRNPYDGTEIARISQATADDATVACREAATAFAETRSLPSWLRAQILTRIAERIAAQAEALARGIALEAGKPIRDARVEVGRSVQTFQVAAEEAKRLDGEILPLDWTPGTENRAGLIRRFPIGPVLGITPFNFPINLVSHKVAPAIASGNPIIIKPAPQTPMTALALGKIVVEAGWPAGGISVLPCSNDVTAVMLHDEHIRMLSFTGSAAVGWELRAAVPKKRVVLELGGNAACIVHADADVELAAKRIVAGGFVYSGQSCISVQRVFVHEDVRELLLSRIVSGVNRLVVGDPLEETTQIGPMVNQAAAVRAESWIREAVETGATLLTGGQRRENILEPAVLADVKPDSQLAREEAFAPVIFVNSYTDFFNVLTAVNNSRYGLQAAVFTSSWDRMTEAWNTLEVGAVLINETSAWRAEHMPYGGVKDSGIGREGLRSAIEEMTDPRMLVVKL
jgi:acyl-CoA reductase-like NAD-dependent aldehyde dehydrogenase